MLGAHMVFPGNRPWWVYLTAVAALAACLWVGWGDFDPRVPQEAVREAIRAAPRQAVQYCVQYLAPVLLLGFLAAEAAAHLRSRRKGR